MGLDRNNAVFTSGEADAWYRRNAETLAAYDPKRDIVRKHLDRLGLADDAYVLDLGCSSGERLSALPYYGIGVDASEEAIAVAFNRDDLHGWWSGDWTDWENSRPADVVITSYVWHWVSRAYLYRAAYSVDRNLKPGGYLIINDFWPAKAERRPYHHRPEDDVWTYKQRYHLLFTSSLLYSIVSIETYPYPGYPDELGACVVLRKSVD